MKTTIYELDEKSGNIEQKAIYTTRAKQALICYIEQLKHNFNTWNYPKDITGITESITRTNVFYFKDSKRSKIISAFQTV